MSATSERFNLFLLRNQVLVAERIEDACRRRVQRRLDARADSRSVEHAHLVLEQARQHLAERRDALANAVRPVMGGAP